VLGSRRGSPATVLDPPALSAKRENVLFAGFRSGISCKELHGRNAGATITSHQSTPALFIMQSHLRDFREVEVLPFNAVFVPVGNLQIPLHTLLLIVESDFDTFTGET